ncbi:MAG TPA: hypothetical protein VHN99_00945, partial [Deinococcales bacterium]|nr:hypothetical protein [Deinococcales bacterium]
MAGNAILDLALAGEFECGWREYGTLAAPTPEDDRWAGACLAFMGKLQAAERLLGQASARGCAPAGIELATALRHLGRPAEARALLARLEALPRIDAGPDDAAPCEGLTLFDQALLAREFAQVERAAGRLNPATAALAEAWTTAQRTPQGRLVTASIDLIWADVLLSAGRLAAAEEHVTRGLQAVTPARRPHALVLRARLDLARGDLSAAEAQARASLDAARPYGIDNPEAGLTLVRVHAARGNLALAARDVEGVLRAAAASGATEQELKARLLAANVETQRENFGLAAAHLRACERLARGAWDEGLIRLRRGAKRVARGDARALADLQAAEAVFQRLELPRDLGWARLHLMEAHLAAGNAPAAEEAGRGVNACRDRMDNGLP